MLFEKVVNSKRYGYMCTGFVTIYLSQTEFKQAIEEARKEVEEINNFIYREEEAEECITIANNLDCEDIPMLFVDFEYIHRVNGEEISRTRLTWVVEQ